MFCMFRFYNPKSNVTNCSQNLVNNSNFQARAASVKFKARDDVQGTVTTNFEGGLINKTPSQSYL